MSAPNETHLGELPDEFVPDLSGQGAPSVEGLLAGATKERSRRTGNQGSDFAGKAESRYRLIDRPRDGGEADEVLFKAYQAGDQASFMKIYGRYKSSIWAYCARAMITAGFEEEQIADTFQEVFLRVAQYQHTFTGGEFKAWIFTVTRHTCLSARRKGLKNRLFSEPMGDGDTLEQGASSELRSALSIIDDPLENLAKKEQTELLLKAIEMLPEAYREALIMSDYEGLTYDEIGKLTGTSLSTVRIRVFRAKAKLRKLLAPIIADQRRAANEDPTQDAEE